MRDLGLSVFQNHETEVYYEILVLVFSGSMNVEDLGSECVRSGSLFVPEPLDRESLV